MIALTLGAVAAIAVGAGPPRSPSSRRRWSIAVALALDRAAPTVSTSSSSTRTTRSPGRSDHDAPGRSWPPSPRPSKTGRLWIGSMPPSIPQTRRVSSSCGRSAGLPVPHALTIDQTGLVLQTVSSAGAAIPRRRRPADDARVHRARSTRPASTSSWSRRRARFQRAASRVDGSSRWDLHLVVGTARALYRYGHLGVASRWFLVRLAVGSMRRSTRSFGTRCSPRHRRGRWIGQASATIPSRYADPLAGSPRPLA